MATRPSGTPCQEGEARTPSEPVVAVLVMGRTATDDDRRSRSGLTVATELVIELAMGRGQRQRRRRPDERADH